MGKCKKIRRLILLFVCIGILDSCYRDPEFDPNKFPQTWQLVAMTDSVTTTGSNMPWQETYFLKHETYFSKLERKCRKLRVWPDTGGMAGFPCNFIFFDSLGERYLELTYPDDDFLIGNCVAQHIETLLLASSTKLIGTWQNCGGPRLEYRRTE